MESDFEPVCTVRQIEGYYQPAEPSFPRCFDIVVDFELLRLVPVTDDDDDPVPWVCRDGTIKFRFDVDRLLQINTAKWTLLNMLLGIGVAGYEEHVSMVEEIIRFAVEMVSDERNRDLHILPMGVYIMCLASGVIHGLAPSALQNEGEEDEDGFTLMDGEYEDIVMETTTVPMPHESFEEQLKNVMIVEGGELTCCIICLEDICMGSSATCMPCSHVYHGDCIKEWLINNRSCPLCRFEI